MWPIPFALFCLGWLLGYVTARALRDEARQPVHVISNLPRGVAIATVWRNKHWN